MLVILYEYVIFSLHFLPWFQNVINWTNPLLCFHSGFDCWPYLAMDIYCTIITWSLFFCQEELIFTAVASMLYSLWMHYKTVAGWFDYWLLIRTKKQVGIKQDDSFVLNYPQHSNRTITVNIDKHDKLAAWQFIMACLLPNISQIGTIFYLGEKLKYWKYLNSEIIPRTFV